MRLVDTDESTDVQGRWRAFPVSGDTLENIFQICTGVPTLLHKLLKRNNTLASLVHVEKRDSAYT